MCILVPEPEVVANTKIFARTDGLFQMLVYQMVVATQQPIAMILPVPVHLPAREDSLHFVDFSSDKRFLERLIDIFPRDTEYSFGTDATFSSGSSQKLVVHRVGSYIATFVPTRSEFSRVDSRFHLPNSFWEDTKIYEDWGFAVFQLDFSDDAAWLESALSGDRQLGSSPMLIVLTEGADKGRKLSLGEGQRATVGRKTPAEFVLASDSYLSNQHFCVELRNGTIVLRDLESRNKTKVNDQFVRETSLSGGDIVRAGQSEFLVYVPGVDARKTHNPSQEVLTTSAEFEPIGLVFESRDPTQLFFPTLHLHSSAFEPEADFDHILLAQGLRPAARDAGGSGPRHNDDWWLDSVDTLQKWDAVVRTEMPARLHAALDFEQSLFKYEIHGTRPNKDVWAKVEQLTTQLSFA